MSLLSRSDIFTFHWYIHENFENLLMICAPFLVPSFGSLMKLHIFLTDTVLTFTAGDDHQTLENSNKEAIWLYAELFLGISKYIIYLVEIILDYFAVVLSSALISPIFFEDN